MVTDPSKYFAHTAPLLAERPELNAWEHMQTMDDHEDGVYDLMNQHAGKFSGRLERADVVMKILAYFHDLGKYSEEFQSYLTDNQSAQINGGARIARRIDHKHGGACYLMWFLQKHPELPDSHKLVIKVCALLIAGHHSRLEDFKQAITNGMRIEQNLHQKEWHLDELIPITQNSPKHQAVMGELVAADFSDILNCYKTEPTGMDFVGRLLYSVFVDSDHRDTQHHGERILTPCATLGTKEIGESAIEDFDNYYDKNFRKTGSGGRDILNKARAEMYDNILEKVESSVGIYRMSVPTGGGKTEASLSFALKHARHHKMDRIIFAIPFTTITAQTTARVRKYLPSIEDGLILEHHSAFIDDDLGPSTTHGSSGQMSVEDEAAEAISPSNARRHNTKTWDVPIVISTTVQLFESLFSNRPSKVRKNHNMMNTVIVIDEAQTLPTELIAEITDRMDHFREMNTTIVLSTATQPSFKETDARRGKDTVVAELLDGADAYHDLFNKRFVYHDRTRRIRSLDTLAETITATAEESSQVLVIVNKRKSASELYEQLRSSIDKSAERLFHLSKNMTNSHCAEVIETVRQRLDEGKSCIVVATQLIEAGVDIDFPTVYRELGPLDSIIQAAGRCNRNNTRSTGDVYITGALNGQMPKDYQNRIARSSQIIARNQGSVDAAIKDAAVYKNYYQDISKPPDPDMKAILNGFRQLAFATVDGEFRMIDDATTSVLIAERLKASSPQLLRKLQNAPSGTYLSRREQSLIGSESVNIYDSRGAPIHLFTEEKLGVLIWNGTYDSNTGIVQDSGESIIL